MLTVTILGATGSIGQSTIDLLLQHPDRFRIGGLVAGRDVAAITRLAGNLQPDFVALNQRLRERIIDARGESARKVAS